MEIDSSLMEIFLNESWSYLAVLEDPEKGIKEKADAAHGLKGVSSMLDFGGLSSIAATLEHKLRAGDAGELSLRVPLLRKGLQAIQRNSDQLLSGRVESMASSELLPPETLVEAEKVIRARAFEPPAETVEKAPWREKTANCDPDKESDWDPETAAILTGIFLEEAGDLMDKIDDALDRLDEDPANPELIHTLFRATHTLKGAAGTVGFDELSKAAHFLENQFDEIRSKKEPMDAGMHQMLVLAVDRLHSMVQSPTDRAHLASMTAEICEIFDRPAASREISTLPDAGALGSEGDAAGVLDKSEDADQPSDDEHALEDEEIHLPTGERRRLDRRWAERRDDDRRLIRLPVERVDRLMEEVGELVFNRTRIQRKTEEVIGLLKDLAQSHRALRTSISGLATASKAEQAMQRLAEVEVELADEVVNFERAVSGLVEDTEDLRRISGRLQEDLVRVRMMSVEFLMTRLRRSARRIAEDQGKKVEVIIEGEKTEMDKSVAERLTDPMIHLVRNAVAHGIETIEERRAQGKPETGVIRIIAQQEGETVTLILSDDGRGIDPQVIRESLARRQMMSSVQALKLSDEEALETIFRPGFTTRRSTDDVSGRGVGLDVVKESIALLSGELRVVSRIGKGTEFFIRLPLLAAISNALLFKVGGQVYALSVSHVEETFLLSEEKLEQCQKRGNVMVRDRLLRFVDLPRLLNVEPQRRGRFVQCIVARWADQRFVMVCDKTVGPREIVVKPLGGLLSPLPLYCGATISGAGKVQLVLDPAGLAKAAGLQTVRPSEPQASSSQLRILVCDDSRSIREVVSRILLQAGYTVEVASDGWDAWERMVTVPVDLLLTDLEMPRLDGYTLIEKVRRQARYHRLPIVVLTSRTGDTNRQRASTAGADVFLTKPVNRRIILKHVQDLLRN